MTQSQKYNIRLSFLAQVLFYSFNFFLSLFFPVCLGHGMCVDLLWTRAKALLFSAAMGMLGVLRSQTSCGCELY